MKLSQLRIKTKLLISLVTMVLVTAILMSSSFILLTSIASNTLIPNAVEAELRLIISELKGSMFLTGCRNIEELAGASKVITGITATWFEGLGGMG